MCFRIFLVLLMFISVLEARVQGYNYGWELKDNESIMDTTLPMPRDFRTKEEPQPHLKSPTDSLIINRLQSVTPKDIRIESPLLDSLRKERERKLKQDSMESKIDSKDSIESNPPQPPRNGGGDSGKVRNGGGDTPKDSKNTPIDSNTPKDSKTPIDSKDSIESKNTKIDSKDSIESKNTKTDSKDSKNQTDSKDSKNQTDSKDSKQNKKVDTLPTSQHDKKKDSIESKNTKDSKDSTESKKDSKDSKDSTKTDSIESSDIIQFPDIDFRIHELQKEKYMLESALYYKEQEKRAWQVNTARSGYYVGVGLFLDFVNTQDSTQGIQAIKVNTAGAFKLGFIRYTNNNIGLKVEAFGIFNFARNVNVFNIPSGTKTFAYSGVRFSILHDIKLAGFNNHLGFIMGVGFGYGVIGEMKNIGANLHLGLSLSLGKHHRFEIERVVLNPLNPLSAASIDYLNNYIVSYSFVF